MKRIFFPLFTLLMAFLMVSCDDNAKPEEQGGELVITFDKDIITSDGKDFSTITVKFNGEPVTEGVEFFDADNEPFEIPDFKFSTSQEGEYEFWAAYKMSMSEPVVIKAVPLSIPEPNKDSDPENTSFSRKVFLTQFTGTGCGYCPGMISVLDDLMDDTGIAGNVVLAAVHSYNADDPAYISAPSSGALGGNGYPFLSIDLSVGYNDYTRKDPALVETISSRLSQKAKVGISVNPVLKDGYLVTKVSVKAAEAGEYLVGAWLVEDGLFGTQADYLGIKDSSFDTHNNCVRVADSKGEGFAGYPVGALEVGQVVDKTFVMKVKDSWKQENLHLIVFTSNPYQKGKFTYYEVNNVVDVPIDEPTPFEYVK